LTQISEELCLRMKSELSLFRFLSEADMAELPCFFDLMEVEEGETVCREGDSCEFLAFIVAGRLEIRKETEFKGKTVILGVYSKGSIVGELCILDNAPRAITAVALEKTTLVVLSRENLDKQLDEHPNVGVNLLKGLMLAVSIRLRKSFDRLAAVF